MKKILLIILGLTLIVAGCSDSAKKDKTMEKLSEMSADKAEKKFEDSGYVPVEMGVGTIYIKIDGENIKDEEKLQETVEGNKDGVIFQFSTDVGSNSFYAKKNVNDGDNLIQFSVVVSGSEVLVTITSSDLTEYNTNSVSYKFVEGELTLATTDLDDGQNELVRKHEGEAKTFLDKSFEELSSVIE